MTMYHIGFIIEQELGHRTHGQNLREQVQHQTDIVAHWVLPGQDRETWASPLPVIGQNWTVQAGLQSRQGLKRLEKNYRLDVLFFHTQVTAVLAQNHMRRTPSVVSLDATPRQYDQLGDFYAHATSPSWLETLKFKLNRQCYQTAAHIVSWSDWAKQSLINEYGISGEKITTIPPGVEVQAWQRPRPRPTPTADQPVKILFVGGNLARKGGLILLEAFRQLRREAEAGDLPPVELHLATRDQIDDEPGLHTYYNMQPNTPELKALYHEADLFCLPTYGDCLPMVLSEAAAAGLPAVSTRVGAIEELVHEDKTGYLVPTGDARALTEALRTLVSNPNLRTQQSKTAVATVKDGFDAAENAARLFTLLRRVATPQSAEKVQPL